MIWTFDGMGNRHDAYRGKDYMKVFYEFLREHAMKISNFEKKEMIPQINELYEKVKICNIYK